MAEIQKNIRETPEFSEYTSEIEYVITCMLEDIRRLDRNFDGFPTMNDYRERVIADNDQILRNIDGMEELEKRDIGKSTKKSQSPATKSFNDMVKEQRSKNHIQKDEGLSSQLEELHRYLDKAWDELGDALNLISDSAYPELQGFSNKCDEYCNAIGMMCLDVKELCDKWSRMS